MFSIGSFVLTDDEVRRRKAYLEIGPEDERRLAQAHPVLSGHTREIIDRFYEYLLSHPHTRAMLSSPGLIDRLKELQVRYFRELTAGRYDLEYFENRLRVGQAHERVGLSPEWYLGAYDKYLHIVSDVLSRSFARDYEGFFQTMVSLTKVIYLDMSLAIDAYIYSAHDRLRRKTGELEEANAQLRRLQSAKQQLTDMIVHDLQNPLAGIVAFLQVLDRKEAGLSPPEREALREALRRCDDLSQMILNVLQVSRADEGRLQTYIEDVDLARVAREGAEAFRLLAEREGRPLEIVAPAPVPVRTDQTLVRRVIYNLVRNALRHTPSGTRVTVRAEAVPRPRLVVADDGRGVPREAQAHLFERFGAAQLRSAGLRVDTGLGLAFCKAAADALGATLSVESDGARGCEFRMEF
jgi:signal transduction histidine kinase